MSFAYNYLFGPGSDSESIVELIPDHTQDRKDNESLYESLDLTRPSIKYNNWQENGACDDEFIVIESKTKSMASQTETEIPLEIEDLSVSVQTEFVSEKDTGVQCNMLRDIPMKHKQVQTSASQGIDSLDLLERNMALKNELHRKNKDLERASIRHLRSQNSLKATQSELSSLKEKNHSVEKQLSIIENRFEATIGYHERLSGKIQTLTATIEELTHERNMMQAKGNMSEKTTEALQELEFSFKSVIDKVQVVLRPTNNSRAAATSTTALCMKCNKKRAITVFIPCKHQVICDACSIRLIRCPIDGQRICQRINTPYI